VNEMLKLVKEGKMWLKPGKVFKIEEIVKAHEVMEANQAGGKIVVLTD